MFNKLRQIKELRSQAKVMQKTLSTETVHAASAGDKINIVLDGNQKILSLDIDPAMLHPEKKQDVEEGVKDCFEKAMKKLQLYLKEKRCFRPK